MTNYFSLFNLPTDYDVNLETLNTAHQELLKKTPEQLAKITTKATSTSEKSTSAHSTSPITTEPEEITIETINHAYATLASPAKRANYLLGLYNQHVRLDQSINDLSFYDTAMDLVEQISQADNETELLSFKQDIYQWINALGAEFKRESNQQDWQEAADTTRKMYFLINIAEDIASHHIYKTTDDTDNLDYF